MDNDRIAAVYENGVFRPVHSEKVSFDEGQAVWLQITPRASAQEILDAAAAVYEGMTEQEIDEFEKKFLRRGDFFRPNAQK